MFKRLFWMSVGMVAGVGSSFWVLRWVQAQLDRLRPHRVSQEVAATARTVRTDVREALAEGRRAMHEREGELRARVDARNGAGGAPRPR